MASQENVAQAVLDGYSSKDGLLWRDGKLVALPVADHVANKYGFVYVEHLVRALDSVIITE